jgi:hypothetical protein
MARERSVIIDDDDPPPKRSAEPRHTASRFGFEWGLASTIIGATLLILSPLALILISAMTRWSYDGYSSRHDTMREILLYGSLVGAGLVSMIGIFFGIRSVSHARSDESPAALGLTGMLFCFAAMMIWVGVAVLVLAKPSEF